MRTIEYHLHDEKELADACMSFIKDGGLFIKTNMSCRLGDEVSVSVKLLDDPTLLNFAGKVVWITPEHEQNNLPQGIGLQFPEKTAMAIRSVIEKHLPEAFLKNTGIFGV